MAELGTVWDKTRTLSRELAKLLKLSGYYEYGDLSDLEMDLSDKEQVFLRDKLRKVMEQATEIVSVVSWLERPVLETSRLHKNENGKYETEHGHQYSSGSLMEALISDAYHDTPYWVQTSVEHDGRDYYLAGHSDVALDGLTVRVR